HESIGVAAPGGRLEGPRRREVGGIGTTRHVRVARGVHGDPVAPVVATAPEVGGVNEHRIDDQRPAGVVGRDLKPNLSRALEDVTTGYLLASSVHFLVDDGLPLA